MTTSVKITPLQNPHSMSSKIGKQTSKNANVMDDILEKIKEKSKQEYLESKKPKTLRKKEKALVSDEGAATVKSGTNLDPESEAKVRSMIIAIDRRKR